MQPDEIKAYVAEVAEKLGETEEKPVNQIALLVEHAGKEFVEEHLAETLKIEENGGMMTDDKKRRRTKGGVFFYIIKGKLDAEIRGKIFPGYGQSMGKSVAWEERQEYMQPLIDGGEHGEMRYVIMTLHGRPGKVHIEDNSVMTTIAHTHGQIPLPRGVPHPPQEETLYTVYMPRKSWDEIEESLKKYKNDRLVVEGTIFYDKETETIAIMATRVSTKRMDKAAKREEQKSKPGSDKKAPESDVKKASKSSKPTKTAKPMPQPKPQVQVDIPDGTPPDAADKLRQLHSAAETLRERIAAMEEKGQAGVAMTKKLLRNTEKQIEALEKMYAS